MKLNRSEELREVLALMGDGYSDRNDMDVSVETLMGGALVGLVDYIGGREAAAAVVDVLNARFPSSPCGTPMGDLMALLVAALEEANR